MIKSKEWVKTTKSRLHPVMYDGFCPNLFTLYYMCDLPHGERSPRFAYPAQSHVNSFTLAV